MLTEDERKEFAEAIEAIYQQLEFDVMNDIVRRISLAKEITRTADWQLYQISQLRTYNVDLRKKIQKALKLSDAEMQKLYDQVLAEGYARDEALYQAVGVPFTPFWDNVALQQVIRAVEKQTENDFMNITRTTGFVLSGNGLEVQTCSDYFRNQLNRATIEIMSGTFNYDETLKRITNEMANSGLRQIDYASGHHDRIDVATRRAVMTGLGQVTAKVTEENAEKLQTDYYEVSAHLAARPSHAIWQGKVYTMDQLISICGLGTGPGLCGWNCYHHYDPFIPGISVRKYSDEYLSNLYQKTLEKHEYKDEEYTMYEATQRQRALERKMRVQDEKIRLMKQGGAPSDEIKRLKLKRTATYQEYREFSKAMGLPEQMNRVFNSEPKR